jgi:hypothetical protein
MKNKFMFLKGIKIVAGITFFVLLVGFGTMHLWNWLVPVLFHGPIIDFCQTIGLLILSKILFGGFHGGWKGRGHCGGNRQHWKQRMEERIANMTPEEKEKFKSRCGGKYWATVEAEQKND